MKRHLAFLKLSRLALVATLLGAAIASAATKTSTTAGNWTALTWSPAGAPAAGDDVVIATAVTLNTTTTVQSLTVNNGNTLTMADGTTVRTLIVSGGVTINGTITAGSAAATHNLQVGGNFANNGSFTAVNGSGSILVTFNGTTGQSISGTTASQIFNNVALSKSGGTLDASGLTSLTVNNLTQNTGNFTAPATLDIIGTLTLSAGTFTAGASITIAGSWVQATGVTFTPGSGTVTFDGAAAAMIGTASSLTFYNLAVNKPAGTLGMNTTGTLTVNDLILTAGSFTPPGAFNINGSLTLAASATLAAGTINIGGNWSNNGGVFNQGSGTVNFTNTTAGQTIGGSAASQTFNNLTVNKSGQTLSVGGSTTTLTLTGTMTLTAGTFDAGTAAAIILTTGNWSNNGGIFNPETGTVSFTSTTAGQTIGGSALSQSFYNLIVNKSGQTLSFVTTTTFTVHDLTETVGGFTPPATLNIMGNFTHTAGTFTQGTGTVAFNGFMPQTLGGATATTFYSMTVNNSAGVTLATSPTVNGTLTLTSGDITTTASYQVIVANTADGAIAGGGISSYINGGLQKTFPSTGNPHTFTFPIGDAANYTPVNLAAMTVTTAGNLTARTTSGDHAQIATSGIDSTHDVNRYWTLTNSPSGIAVSACTATFNFINPGDLDAGANTANFVVRRYNGTWSASTTGMRGSTSATATGLTTFGDFAIGDQAADATHSTVGPATASITADGTSTQVITVQARDVFNANLPTGGSTVVFSKSAGTGTVGNTTDNGNGTYTATVTSPTTVGSGTFVATLGGTAVGTAVSASQSVVTYTAGTATQLAYTAVPTVGTAGTAFSVTIQSQDANGNPANPTSATTITLSKATGGGSLSGTLAGSIPASGNSVTIATPIYSRADTITLTASATAGMSLSPVTSGNIVFSAGSAAKLQVLMPGESAAPGTGSGKTGTPTTQVAGTGLGVIVNAVDANWNLVNTVTHIVAITSSDANATLPSNAALVNGTQTFGVTFKTVSVNGWTVTATDQNGPPLTPNTGAATPVNAGADDHLAFVTQPSDTVFGQTMTPPVTVQVLDQFGNQTASSASVSLAIGNNPASGTLSGTIPEAAGGGVATFSDLSINNVGSGYTLIASSSGLAGATSYPFRIQTATGFSVKTRVTGAANWSAETTWEQLRSGTAAFVSGSASVVGTGTHFASELQAGDVLVLDATPGTLCGTVLSITDDTHLTLTTTAGATLSGAYGREKVPGSADEVQIGNTALGTAVTVTLDVSSATVNSLTFISAGLANTLTHSSANSLTVNNNAAVSAPSANVTIAWNISAGTASVGGDVAIGANSTSTSSSRISTIVLTTGTLTIGGDLQYSLSQTGSSAASAVLSLSGAATVNLAGNITFPSLAVGTLTPGTSSTVVYNGANAQTVSALSSIAYNNLTINKASGTATLSASTTIGGNLTLTQGTLSASASNFGLTLGGNWLNNGGTFSGGTSTVTLTAPTGTIGGTASTTFPALVIDAGSVYTMNNNNSCSSLTFTASGTASSLTHSGTTLLTVNGPVTINQPTAAVTTAWNINGGTATVSGLITLAGTTATASHIGAVVITTGTLNANGGMTFVASAAATKVINMSGGAGVLNLEGALTAPGASSTLTAGTTSTFNYSDSADQTINFFSAGAYNNLTINNSGVNGATLSATITSTLVTGNLSVQSGTLNNGGFAITLASGKNFALSSGATFNLTGTSTMVSVSGGGTKTFDPASTVNYAGAGAAQNVSAENYGNLTSSGAGGGTKTLLAGTTSVAGDLTIAPSTTFAAGANNFSLAGDWLNNGSYSSSTGQTVAFNGLGTQNIGGSATTTFNTLALTGQQLSLANGMTFPVTTFSIGGAAQSSGTWGGTGSGAANSDPTHFAATTGTLIVSTGPLDHFAVTTPGTQTAGTAFAITTITAKDANNNTVVSFTGTVDLTETGGGAGGTATPSQSGAFTLGVLSGQSVTLTKAGSGVTITATDHAPTGTIGVSGTFTVNPGVLDHFSIATISSPQTAGTAITGINLTAQDVNNNTQTSFTGTVTYSGTAGITGTSSAFTSGVLSGVSVTPTVAGNNLTFIVTGSTKTGTATIATINPGAMSQLVMNPTTIASATAGTAVTLTSITAKDANGNFCSSGPNAFTGTVTFGGTAGATGTSAAFSTGVLTTFPTLTPTVAGSGKTITATSGSVVGTTTITTVNPGALDHFAFTGVPSTATAGTAMTGITITAQDLNNNTQSSFASTVTYSGTAGVTGTSGSFTAGVLSGVSLTPTKAGSGMTVIATGSAKTGTATITTVNPGAMTQLVMNPTTIASATAGSSVSSSFTSITAEDANGNTCSSGPNAFSGTVTFGGTAGASGTSAAFSAGVLTTFPALTPTVAGSDKTITATSGSVVGTTTITTVNPGAMSQLVMNPATIASATAGSSVSGGLVSITAKDANGNTCSSGPNAFTGTVTFGGTAGATGTSALFTAGVLSTFPTLTPTVAGSDKTITATSGSVVGTTTITTVNPGALSASQSTAVATPTTGVVADGSAASTITATAKDAFGNAVSGLTTTLNASGTGNTLTQPAAPTDASGQTPGMIKSTKAGTKTITVTIGATQINAQPTVQFVAGAATQLAFTTQPGGGTGGTAWAIQPVVTLQDQYGNTVTGTAQDVTLAIQTDAAPGGTLSGAKTVSVDTTTGLATFAGLSIDKAGTGYTLTATGSTVDETAGVVVSSAFDITIGPAAKLAFTSQPGGAVAGSLFSTQPALTLQDAGGNTVLGTAQTVTVGIQNNAAGTATLNGPRTASVDTGTGVVAFSDLSIDKSGIGYTLTATGDTVSTTAGDVVSGAFDVTAPSKLTPVITDSPSQSIAYGTASVTLSGTVVAASGPGSVYAQDGEQVTVTINSTPMAATITGGAGGFSIDFPTATIPASATAYTITFYYPGDSSLNEAGNTATALTVMMQATATVTLPDYLGSAVVVDFVAKPASGTSTAWEATLAASGGVAEGKVAVPAGTTVLSVKPRFYLRQNIPITISDNTITLDLGSYLGGDIDGNNQVDGTDYAWLRYWWGTTPDEWHAIAADDLYPDLNGDGVIDSKDYDILKLGWYQKGADLP